MRLVFVNRFYWPETPATAQLLADLAEALARDGNEVHVIASQGGALALPARETHRGVTIHRVRGTRWNTRAGVLGKACDFASFFLGALWRLGRVADRRSTLIALTDPPLIGVGAWLVAALRGARLVHWIQDIYPELAMELAGQRWLAVLRPLRNAAWRRAAACVTLGGDMAAVPIAAGVSGARLRVIPNWAPAGLAPAAEADIAALRREWQLEGKFVVAYSGNLGRVHDLAPVLAVAEQLRAEPAIAFLFIGGGARRAALEAEARRRGLGNVHFRPAQPRARLAATLGVGDVHLVTLLPGCERLVYPSKLYGIAAVARPVLFIGPRGCELARTVGALRLGGAFTRDEPDAIADALRLLAAQPAAREDFAAAARAFAVTHAFPRALAAWQDTLATAEACTAPGRPVNPAPR
jgi:glycosyltransferase involved in cell wall biosynthesis